MKLAETLNAFAIAMDTHRKSMKINTKPMNIYRTSLIFSISIDACGNLICFAVAMQIARTSMEINTTSTCINWNSFIFNISIEACGNLNLFVQLQSKSIENQQTINRNSAVSSHTAATDVQVNINSVVGFLGGWVCNYVGKIHAMTPLSL